MSDTGHASVFASVPTAARGDHGTTRRRRWRLESLPVAPVLLVGAFLGPHGLGLLTPQVLDVIDPALPVALAVLGVLVSMSQGAGRRNWRPAAVAGLVTFAVVGGGIALGLRAGPPDVAGGWWMSISIGICAASAIALPWTPRADGRRQGDHLVPAEAVLAVIGGAAVLAVTARHWSPAAAIVGLQGIGVAALLAGAGWLLVGQATAATERRVFAVATLLLVGGSADLLTTSPLLAGVVAGIVWRLLGQAATASLAAETQYVQHPFVVLVLLAAGARAEWSAALVGLGAAYASLRAIARFGAGRAVRPVGQPTDVGSLALIPPGTLGVAIAVSVARSVDATWPAIAASIVVLGTVLSDAIARVVAPTHDHGGEGA